MAFLVSPGVEVKEIDLTNIVPAVSTTIGAYAGHFNWGPVGDVVNLGTEKELARYFGAPTKKYAQSYHLAATFLRYGDTLLVSRAIDENASTGAKNATTGDATGDIAVAGTGGNNGTLPYLIRNIKEYGFITANFLSSNFYARCPGAYGNSLKVMIQAADVPSRFSLSQIEIIAEGASPSGKAVQITVDDPDDILSDALQVSLRSIRSREDWVNDVENRTQGFYLGDEAAVDAYGTKTYTLYTDSALTTVWDPDSVYPSGWNGDVTPEAGDPGSTVVMEEESRGFMFAPPEAEDFESAFVTTPGTSVYAQEHGAVNDEIHVLVVDVDGVFSGTAGTVIEKFANLSAATDAKREDGSSSYYKDVINTSSAFIIADNLTGIIDGADTAIVDLETGGTLTFSSSFPDGGSAWHVQMQGGSDGTLNTRNGDVYDALELFADPETLDVNLLFAENDTEASITVANKLISIAEKRKDCVVFISPDLEVKDQSTEDAKLDKVLSKFDRLTSTNYAVFDSTPLYIYDKYNDEYIWVAASGSMAGLCARTDISRDPWFSPAGYNRGQLLGVAKLALNPTQNQRDELYKSRVNPIVSFPGEGIILFGDKTAQAKPSAFDRINVRRLFIVLEKAIAKAAKYSLFEFNDAFTRAQFKALVDPYLRDVQSRRGITDFLVVCDESNNTAEVIDSNRFVADIYIKPARAINFITLNFVATRTGVEFDEVIGRF